MDECVGAERLKVLQVFEELKPEYLTKSVYDRKITVNEYMDIVRIEKDKDKQLKYLVHFYNQYLLVRFNKANKLIDNGYKFNEKSQQEYEMLRKMINDYVEYFKSKGLDMK